MYKRCFLLRILMIFLCLLPCVCALGDEESKHFYTLNVQNGLSSNHIQQMLQLRDSRMVVMTDVAVDVYDGVRFASIPVDGSAWVPLSNYQGELHLFADSHDRIWAKRHKHLYCFNLRTMQQEKISDFSADDFFIDANGETWTMRGNRLEGDMSDRHLSIKSDMGLLQDVEAMGDSVMLFFDTGCMAVYGKSGNMIYRSDAYDKETLGRYISTSLVVRGFDGCLYQVRTGSGGAILLRCNPKKREWTQLLKSDKLMHTLTATPTGWLYLTTPDGYLRIKPSTGESESFHDLYLPDGTALTTGINTVRLDYDGGVWLGSYDNGILYTSPLSGIFDTQPIDIEVYPILTTIYLHGRPLQVDKEYDGRQLLNVAPPYADDLTLDYNQNSLAFQFSTMNCVRPRSTCYRYRFSGEGEDWHTLSADSVERLVDDKGIFYLPLVGLSPGEYTLEVMATTNPEHWNPELMRTISFTILPPWWQTPVFYVLYALLSVAVVALAFMFYRRRLQRRNREEMLLLRIQNLVEQVNRYEHSEAMVVLSEPDANVEEESEPEPTQQEKEFMERATRLVEQHMSDPLYNVEHLAADLCMERTGLYKKLTAMMQQSPVAFIRSIRLHRAAAMLKSGDKSIADVAMLTGFSSPSYFSKCFQKEFGCKPSEYTDS